MSIIVLNVRRWFEKINGNTYHSVALTVDGGETKVAPFTYGYGTHYEHTAGELYGLENPYDFGWRWAQDNGHTIITDVIDVPRRKDLHNGGR